MKNSKNSDPVYDFTANIIDKVNNNGVEYYKIYTDLSKDGEKFGYVLAKDFIKGCIGDGPLALDVALDEEAVAIKKLVSPVAGDADCLLFPNIESGNVFWKTNSKLCKDVRQAGFLVGTKVPCVLASRADSVDVKLNSIASAVMFVK